MTPGRRLAVLLRRERELWAEGLIAIAGVDEAGVGPLAGPVVAAAVIFPRGVGLRGVDDSKRLNPDVRAELAVQIRAVCVTWAVAAVGPQDIDRINIYQASLEAMRLAVAGLSARPERLLVDARKVPGLDVPQESIVGGDAKCHAVAAASILAKTTRDAIMRDYEAEFPGYGFAEHKGYSTDAHRDAIRRLGPCAIHRRSFTLLRPPTLFD